MTTYTEQLEARAAWYAAQIVDLEERINELADRGQRAAAIRAHQRMMRFVGQAEAEGLQEMQAAARAALTGDAEHVQALVHSPKPALPR
jgi:hypothetical protein